MQLQRDRLGVTAIRQSLDREQLVTQLDLGPEGIAFGHGPADHELDDLGHRDVGHVAGGDPRPIAQDGDAVADLHHLVEVMGDEEDADAAPGELADDAEELVGLTRRKGRSGLVEDEHARVGEQRPRNLHQLHLGDAQVLHGRVRRHVQADLGHQFLCSVTHRRAVDQAPPRGQ